MFYMSTAYNENQLVFIKTPLYINNEKPEKVHTYQWLISLQSQSNSFLSSVTIG